MLFPQMWKHCPISVCRTPPGGPLCPHLAPLMRPEEERCSSLIVHSIKRWNGKIPSRLLYLDKKNLFSADKKKFPLYWAVLTTWLNEFLITFPIDTNCFNQCIKKPNNKLTNKAGSNCLEKSWKLVIRESGFRIRENMWWDWSNVW